MMAVFGPLLIRLTLAYCVSLVAHPYGKGLEFAVVQLYPVAEMHMLCDEGEGASGWGLVTTKLGENGMLI